MTFGEHLEELRKCLWRAFLGLAIGTVVGLYFGTDVVVFIQTPIKEALDRYYKQETKDRLLQAATEENTDPEKIKKLQRRSEELIDQSGMLAEVSYLDPAELVEQLKKVYPNQLKDLPEPEKLDNPENPPGMIPIKLWHLQKDDQRTRTSSFGATETFGIYIKASLLVGAIIASPWILYQLWLFVGAGLYSHEKHYVKVYLPFSVVLFLLGASVAFFFAFGRVLDFLFSFNHWTGINPDPRISEWLSFMLLLPVGFGAGFQLPLVMFFLERAGILTVEGYLKQWRLSVLGIVLIAAIFTPPDPFSMLFLAVPLVLLFFGGILLCKYVPRRKSQFASLDR
jgi:sec-independent protein translocase protein TatC